MSPEYSLQSIVDEVVAARRGSVRRVTTVGVGGSVAVGKTVIATELADRLRVELGGEKEVSIGVLSTDALLRSNAEIDHLGLTMRKGFPESYDPERSASLLDALACGDSCVSLPIYSHFTYDIVAGSESAVSIPDVCVIEGVVALQAPLAGGIDVAVYVDAAESDIVAWFTDRLVLLIREAAETPGGFYAGFSSAPDSTIVSFAEQIWSTINVVNLREHIEPSRVRADWIVQKRADHSIERIEPGSRNHG